MATYASDTFTDTTGTTLASHVPNVGTAWTLTTGAGSGRISSTGTMYFNASDGSVYKVGATVPSSVFAVQADLVYKSGSNLASPSLALIASNGTSYYKFWNYQGTWYLQDHLGNTLGSAADTIASGNTYTMRMEYTPSTGAFHCTANGKTINATNTSITPANAGLVNGFSNANGDTTGQHFDNFLYEDVVAALAAGDAFAVPTSATAVKVTAKVATGGGGTYTYKLQQAPDSGGSPGTYADAGTPSGLQAGREWAVTGLTTGNSYWFREVADDGSTTANGAGYKVTSLAAPTAQGSVEYALNVTTAAGVDAGVASHGLDKLYDDDLTTYYQSTATTAAWAGIDLQTGNLGVLTRVLFSAANHFNADDVLLGGTAGGAATTAGPWAALATVQSAPYLRTFEYNSLAVTPGGAFRAFRVAPAGAVACEVGELAFEGWWASGLSWRPARPTITPADSKPPAGASVTITTATTDASIYYTTDGSTPTTGSTLYTGPITLPAISTGTAYVVKAIAYHASGTTTTSKVTTQTYYRREFVFDRGSAPFAESTRYAPGDWRDTDGNLIEAHSADVGWDAANSRYYLLGQFMDSPVNSGDVKPRQFRVYTSTDLYRWTYLGYVPLPANTAAYQDSGNYLDSQTRFHGYYNAGASDANKRWVFWGHLDSVASGYTTAYGGCVTAPSLAGPWTWAAAKMRPKNPAGSADEMPKDSSPLFYDPATGKLWHVYSAEAIGGGTPQIHAAELDPATDYTSYKVANAVAVGPSSREAPVCFVGPDGYYYLITSNGYAYGATNTTGLVYRSAATFAGLSAASDLSVFNFTPADPAVSYFAQGTAALTVRGRAGRILLCDWWDSGGSPLRLDHSRLAWLPMPPTVFSAGVLSMPAPAAWDLSSLPATAGAGALPLVGGGLVNRGLVNGGLVA